MANLQADDIGDLVSLTQKDLGKMRFTEIASQLQEFVAMKNIMKRSRTDFGSGYGISWNIMKDTSDAAANVGLFEVDSVNVADVMVTATIPWRHVTTNYAIERREIAMNRSPARIVELLKIRRTDAMVALAEKLETNWWDESGKGLGPLDDGKLPFGVRYYVVYDSGTPTASDFKGGDPGNFSAGAGGIKVADVPRWKNWSDTYTNVTKADLVRRWRKAATFTRFMQAVPSPSYGSGDNYGYYTNYNVIGPLEEALEAQNDNLGNNIASKDGMLSFRMVPVTWVPQLEGDSNDPVFGINWSVFKTAVLRGEFLNETRLPIAPNQHTVSQTHVDLTSNFVCYDRRRQFIISK